MKKRKAFAFLLGAAVGTLLLTLWPTFAADEELDPLKIGGDAKLVMENMFVRVLEEHMQPGESQAKHKHPHGVVVALSDYQVEGFSFTENRPTLTRRKSGDVSWVEAVVHTVKNTGKTQQHVIRIELKY